MEHCVSKFIEQRIDEVKNVMAKEIVQSTKAKDAANIYTFCFGLKIVINA